MPSAQPVCDHRAAVVVGLSRRPCFERQRGGEPGPGPGGRGSGAAAAAGARGLQRGGCAAAAPQGAAQAPSRLGSEAATVQAWSQPQTSERFSHTVPIRVAEPWNRHQPKLGVPRGGRRDRLGGRAARFAPHGMLASSPCTAPSQAFPIAKQHFSIYEALPKPALLALESRSSADTATDQPSISPSMLLSRLKAWQADYAPQGKQAQAHEPAGSSQPADSS